MAMVTLPNTQNSSLQLLSTLHFYTSTTAGTRPGCRVTATTTCSAASPALEDIKTIIVIRIIHVMFLKIASWVAGNVMTLFRSAPGSKSAISPDIRPVFVSVSIVNSRPMLAPVSVVRCRLQTRAEHLVSKNILSVTIHSISPSLDLKLRNIRKMLQTGQSSS